MYKHFYSRFLKDKEGIQHFACHSHHYWPDVTREAMLEYWDDSATYVDEKWGHIFAKKIPNVQKLIAKELNLSRPESIVFAPNTHEFVFRLLSTLPRHKKNKILTTDSEFHSFDRQIHRSLEEGYLDVTFIPTQPFDTFADRFVEKLKNENFDLVFFSHVFFNSGMAVKDLAQIVAAVQNDATIVIDGYHSFMALPIDLKPLEDRIFFVAGSYKYAQGGEGACFLVCPKNIILRPEYTGWFAELENIEGHTKEVFYPNSALRFAGSTMDFSALYRLEKVLTLFLQEGLTANKIHAYVQGLQKNFIAELEKYQHHYLREKNILAVDYNHHGHFLTFALPSPEHAKKYHDELKKHGILTDFRGSRLRFGFGLYHDGNYDLSALTKIN